MEMKVFGSLLKIGKSGPTAPSSSERAGGRVAARLIEVSRMGADDALDGFHTSIQGLVTAEEIGRAHV